MIAGFIGGWELVLILAVVLILFGAKKLPELAKGLGSGIKEFKKATRDVQDELNSAMDDTPSRRYVPPTPPAVPEVTQTASTATPSTPAASAPNVPPQAKTL